MGVRTIGWGRKGDKGDKGDQGAAGSPGTPGSAATVSVGTTSTLSPGSSATVTNSGSGSAAVLNFGIPAGNTGAAGNPKRVEVYTATMNASGTATINFSSAFTTVPTVLPIATWATDQLFLPVIGAITTSGVSVTAKRSRGTLLLTSGPFETAPSASISVVAIGN